MDNNDYKIMIDNLSQNKPVWNLYPGVQKAPTCAAPRRHREGVLARWADNRGRQLS